MCSMAGKSSSAMPGNSKRLLIQPLSPYDSSSSGDTNRRAVSRSPEDHERMNALEDALESVLKEEGFATLALVSTGENLREWTYYAKSEAEFVSRLNYAFGGTPAFPIEIHTARDPNWEMYEEFKAGIKEIADR